MSEQNPKEESFSHESVLSDEMAEKLAAAFKAVEEFDMVATALAAQAVQRGEEMADAPRLSAEESIKKFARQFGEVDEEQRDKARTLVWNVSKRAPRFLTKMEKDAVIDDIPRFRRLFLRKTEASYRQKALQQKENPEEGQLELPGVAVGLTDEESRTIHESALRASWHMLNSYVPRFAQLAFNAAQDAEQLQRVAQTPNNQQLTEQDKQLVITWIERMIRFSHDKSEDVTYESALASFAADVLQNNGYAFRFWGNFAAEYRTGVAKYFWEQQLESLRASLKKSNKLDDELK